MLMQRSYHQTEELSLSQRNILETKILSEHAPFINRILRPYVGVLDHGTVEELKQTALMTFLTELRKFEHTVNDDFLKSATVRVRGEVIDELRRRDPMERRKRQLVNNVRKAEKALTQKLGRTPAAKEVCQVLDITAEEYHQALQVIVIDDEIELDTLVSGSHEQDPAMSMIELESALANLDEVQQKVMYLLFVEGLNIKETALVLELSESKVFRTKQACLDILKQQLSED